MKRIVFIGVGTRIAHIYSQITQWEAVSIAAICDPDANGARQRLEGKGADLSGTVFYDAGEHEKMLDDICPDGVLIGTRCNLHATLAVSVLRRGIPLFLEKPVGLTDAELQLLEEANSSRNNTVVSFPLRLSLLAQTAKKIVDSGTLGPIAQIQAVNNVPYGRGYFKKWYRDDSITGGLFLQKATHDVDVIRYVTGFEPVTVSAVKSKVIFTGDRPAGLRCSICPEKRSCPESVYTLTRIAKEPTQPDTCSFAVDTGNEDSGTMLLMDAEGRHAVYTQNFVVRKQAGKRQVRIIGLKATLEFNFTDGLLTIFHHYENRVETHRVDMQDGHAGGDPLLARSFLDVMEGKPSPSPLADGIISARICLRAKQSSEAMKFLSV